MTNAMPVRLLFPLSGSAACVLFLLATLTVTIPCQPCRDPHCAECSSMSREAGSIGSSKLAGVHTKVLFGEPAKAGFYSILLFVPPHTTIQATHIGTIAWL